MLLQWFTASARTLSWTFSRFTLASGSGRRSSSSSTRCSTCPAWWSGPHAPPRRSSPCSSRSPSASTLGATPSKVNSFHPQKRVDDRCNVAINYNSINLNLDWMDADFRENYQSCDDPISNVSDFINDTMLSESEMTTCDRASSLLFLLLMFGTVWVGISLFNFNKT